jgi:hypothetical protein
LKAANTPLIRKVASWLPFAEEALEAGDSGPRIDGGVVHGVLADEDGAVVGEGDPRGMQWWNMVQVVSPLS